MLRLVSPCVLVLAASLLVPTAWADDGKPVPIEPVAVSTAPAKPEPFPRDRFDEPLPVARVSGDEVNVRAGPSVDYPSLGKLARGALVVVVGEDGDWRRVRVPGGIVVHVFAKLVAHEEGALTGRVSASDVLMRGAETRARLPVHAQRLQAGDEVLVLERMQTEEGDWLRLVPPARVFVWMHADFLADAGTTTRHVVALHTAARERVDALSGGRTKTHREAGEREASRRFEKELDKLRQLLAIGLVTDAHVKAAHSLAENAPDPEHAARATALGDRLARSRDEREAREEHEAVKEEVRRLGAAARKAREDRERYEREMKELERPKPPVRPKPDVEGTIEVRRGTAYVRWGEGLVVRLESRKYRLADYAGKRVRLWGARVPAKTGGSGKGLLRVEALEIQD